MYPKYKVNPAPALIPQHLLDELATLETATLGHFMHCGFADAQIRAVLKGKRIAATVATLALPGQDSTLLHHAVSVLGEGHFLAVDRLDDMRHACWGGGVTRAAALSKMAGGVIDGVHTDTLEIEEQDFPMWSRGPSPATTRVYDIGGGFNVPVSIGGAAVLPGYAVLADDSGVVFIPPEDLEEVIATAKAYFAAGSGIEEKIAQGGILGQLSGATAKVEAGQG